MSFLALHTHPGLDLHADALLVPAAQAPTLQSALELADALAALRGSEQARIDAAVQAAHQFGLARGLEQGRLQAGDEAATALATLLSRLQLQADLDTRTVQQSVVELALLVVRRIAADLAPADVLASLARRAFDHLTAGHESSPQALQGPGSPPPTASRGITVRVHPDLAAALQAQLAAPAAPGAQRLPDFSVRSDDNLAPMDCVVETPSGRLVAGLESQLARVQASLQRVPATATSMPATPGARAAGGGR